MNKVLETDANGTLVLTPEILGDMGSHKRYRVEHMGGGLLLRPENANEVRTESADEWLARWDELSKKVTDSWKSDKSAVEIVSEMRR